MSLTAVQESVLKEARDKAGFEGTLTCGLDAKMLLAAKPELQAPASDLTAALGVEFPDADMKASMLLDHDSGEPELLIEVFTPEYGKEARSRLRSFFQDRLPESVRPHLGCMTVLLGPR